MNPQELDRLNNDGIKAMGCGNLETARQLFELCHQESAGDPFFAIGPASALATFHWGEYGDGAVAKAKFEFVMETGKSSLAACAMARKLGKANTLAVNLDFAEKFIPQQMGNAAENLMLLSTSYGEFDKWAGELRRLAPKEPILTELVPSVNAAREQGTLWAEQMFQRACSYINIGHFGSAIHPASGACILQLLLANRKQLRVRQDVWQRALMAYHATVCEIGYKAEKLFRARKGDNPYREISGVQQYLMPYTQEYCDAFPNDVQISKLLANAKALAKQSQSAPVRTHASESGATPPPTRSYRIPILWMVGVALSILVGVVAYKMLRLSPKEEPYKGYISVVWAAASLAMWHFQVIRKSRTRPWVSCRTITEECGRKGWKGLSYCLQKYYVDEAAHLNLIFRFTSSLPSDKTDVHMAVRAIVALTLPEVVKAIPQFTIIDPGMGYTIGCGSGVHVPFYTIQRSDRSSIAMLQVGSEMEDSRCRVWIHPSVAIPGVTQDVSAQRKIQGQVGKMFMEMFSTVRVNL